MILKIIGIICVIIQCGAANQTFSLTYKYIPPHKIELKTKYEDKWYIKQYEFNDSGWSEVKKNSDYVNIPNVNPCTSYKIETIIIHNRISQVHTDNLLTEPNAPNSPNLISMTATSLQIKSEYVAIGNYCQIEMFEIECTLQSNNISHHSLSIFDENGNANFVNLKSNAKYMCRAKVKNGAAWSSWSPKRTYNTQQYEKYSAVELYVTAISSKSFHLSWNTTIRRFEIQQQKANVSAGLPSRCEQTKDNGVLTVRIDKNVPEKEFTNLEAHTNYSIKVKSQPNSHILITTNPDVPHKVENLKIENSSSHSVNISFELPCRINGRIKSFVGKFHILKPPSKRGTHFDWNLTFEAGQNQNKFYYLENRISPGHMYNITVGIKLYNFVGSLNESSIGFPSPNSPQLFWYIGLGIMSLMLIGSSWGGVLYYKMRKTKRAAPLNATYIEVKDFPNWYKLVDEHDCIANEFNTLENIDLSTIGIECAVKHPIKNRYLDIAPYDYNRVIITPNEHCTSDYINASYIDGYKREQQYIATQGPKEETVYDFWQMVIEKKCNKIVMITQMNENNFAKCFPYFPYDNKTLKFGDVIIRIMDENNFGNFIRRRLMIAKGLALRTVIHFQYVKWPDRNCPENELDVLEFIEFTKSQQHKSSNPMVVHCSAGIGRTGTFIALDILLQEFRNKKFFSVFETVKKLRLQRSGMVQTRSQYKFLYASINKYYLKRVYK